MGETDKEDEKRKEEKEEEREEEKEEERKRKHFCYLCTHLLTAVKLYGIWANFLNTDIIWTLNGGRGRLIAWQRSPFNTDT